jgi:hypothetical protein
MTRTNPREVILSHLPGSRMQLAERTGLHRTTVIHTVNKMHADGELRICRWVRHPVRGPSIPIYSAGPGKDAVDKIPRLTKKQISARYEERIKGTEKHDQRKAYQRSRWWTKKAVATPQTWFSALMPAKQSKSNEAASSANN